MDDQEASVDLHAGDPAGDQLGELVAIETRIAEAARAFSRVVGDGGETAEVIAAMGSGAAAAP